MRVVLFGQSAWKLAQPEMKGQFVISSRSLREERTGLHRTSPAAEVLGAGDLSRPLRAY